MPDSLLTPPPCYVGIDPGASGAVAVLCGLSLTIFDIPTEIIRRGRKERRRIVCPEMIRIAQQVAALRPAQSAVESVGGLPGQSASAAFNFGQLCGVIECAFAAAECPLMFVSPAAWKAHHMLIGASKNDSRETAAKLFPAYSSQFARVKDDGRAEAALIAAYLRASANGSIESRTDIRREIPSRAARGGAIRPAGVR